MASSKYHHPPHLQGWYFTGNTEWCDYCNARVATIVVKWMQQYDKVIRCSRCLLKIRSAEYAMLMDWVKRYFEGKTKKSRKKRFEVIHPDGTISYLKKPLILK